MSPTRPSAIRLLDLADAALAVALCAVGLGYWRYLLGGSSGIEVAAIAATTLPVTFRRRWPLQMHGAVVAASCAHLVVAPDQVLGPWLGGVVVAFYSVARHRPRRRAAAVLIGATVAYLMVAMAVVSERLLACVPPLVWWLAALVGDSTREHTTALDRERRQREHDAVLAERARISRELHDVVAHHLSVIVLQAGAAQTMLEDERPVATLVSTIEDTGRQALTEMRRLLGALRSAEHEDGAPPLAPAPGLAEVPALAERVTRAGLPVEVAVEGSPDHVSAELDRAAYRIVQEALTNALRHAGRARARVRVRYLPNDLEIEVSDTGVGATSARRPGARHSRYARACRSPRRRDRSRPGRAGRIRRSSEAAAAGRRAVSLKVVVADDQPLVRAGLRVILDAQADIQVVGEAADGHEAVEAVRRWRPDVALLDVRMPRMDGIEATKRISQEAFEPRSRVLILTTFDLDEYVFGALRAGASGFILKDSPREDLVAAVRAVAAGDGLLAPSVTGRLIREFVRRSASPPPAQPGELGELTTREREVMELIARGLSNTEIARRLVLAEGTVKAHVSNLLTKLGLRDRVQAVIAAYEWGMIRPNSGG